jgi:hypothetical protein
MTQDSFYRVFQYYSGTSNYTFDEKYQFTIDQIYPNVSTIHFLGAAASEKEFAFFAYSNVVPYSDMASKLLIRTMNPDDGSVRQTYEFMNLPGFDPTMQQITNITYNNFGGFTLALKSSNAFVAICKHNAATSSITVVTPLALGGANANIDRLITRQSPKEEFGGFYVFPFRNAGIVDYIRVTPSNILQTTDPNYSYNAFTGSQETWPTSDPCQIQVMNMAPGVYREPIVSRNPFKDYIYMLSESDPTRFYEVTSFTSSNQPAYTSNAVITTSAYQFPVNTSNFTQGADGAKLSLIGNVLYGNRNDIVDGPRKIHQAWQLFYPLQRIVFKQIAKNFTFLNNYSNLTYPEYPHTALIGYNSLAGLESDISGKWGMESSGNFVVADFQFRGPTFNSMLFSFPLEKSDSNYYLAVRNYSPTEKSQVLMRFSLTNLYDYGYITMYDLSNEAVITQTQSNLFDPNYYKSLTAFNSNFIIGSNGKVFGSNIVQGFAGSNFSNVTGFGDFYGRFVSIYNEYNAQVQLVQKINTNVSNYVANFIQTDLQYILPASSLNRQRFTDPLTFSILWKSSLLPRYRGLDQNWGLGWNLGYAKMDTPYETAQIAESFFKIQDDFINLRMNREFDMNRMDTGAKENLSETLETTGVIKAFHGKLLLAPFGSYAQTVVSNPVSFYPPIGRMDKLTFTWVDVTGATIDNSDCEWNAVVQIVEEKDVVEISKKPRIQRK